MALIKNQYAFLHPIVDRFKSLLSKEARISFLSSLLNQEETCDDELELCLRLLKQSHLLPLSQKGRLKLEAVHALYAPIGGILGYHHAFLEKLLENKRNLHLEACPPKISLDLTHGVGNADWTAYVLPRLGEVYVLGGLASRLDLKDIEGKRLPAAFLPFRGRSLLEGLIRDVEGKEAYYRSLFGKDLTIPIAMMASDVEGNAEMVLSLLEKNDFFGRPPSSVRLFKQIGVPVLTEEGVWVSELGEPLFQPGGHGALWATAQQQGIFSWFRKLGIQALLVRQINNPLGDLDGATLPFIATGIEQEKKFGFASCPTQPGAAEGVLMTISHKNERTLSNIEYTEFKRYALDPKEQHFANTNLLFADLDSIEQAISQKPFPGMVLNLKEKKECAGEEKRVGRLEGMMQSISDQFYGGSAEKLPTFLSFNQRLRTISTAKKKFIEGESWEGTPEKAYYDWCLTHHLFLEKKCGWQLPRFPDKKSYLEKGMSYIFDYHPQLGPTFEKMKTRLKQGALFTKSYLSLEIQQVWIEGLVLKGALKIRGPSSSSLKIHNLSILNKGVLFSKERPFWQHAFNFEECVEILLEEESELVIENLSLHSGKQFHVPSHERWVVTEQGIEIEALLKL